MRGGPARWARSSRGGGKEEKRIDDGERYRCLCSDLVSEIPPTGQILNALYGPLGGDAVPRTLTVEVPGFEPVEDVPVSQPAC